MQARKMSFTIFQNEKTPFQGIKTTSSKSSKIVIFPKGLTHGFGPKFAIFATICFSQFRPRKCLLQYSSVKSSKIVLFQKGLTHGFGLKFVIFPTLFFQSIQTKKMSFTIFQNVKTPFQGIRKTSSKRSKIDIFAKGLTHGFGSKMVIFQTFFFAIQAKKMSFTIFQNEKRLSTL